MYEDYEKYAVEVYIPHSVTVIKHIIIYPTNKRNRETSPHPVREKRMRKYRIGSM